jgi:hypothetical protein
VILDADGRPLRRRIGFELEYTADDKPDYDVGLVAGGIWVTPSETDDSQCSANTASAKLSENRANTAPGRSAVNDVYRRSGVNKSISLTGSKRITLSGLEK